MRKRNARNQYDLQLVAVFPDCPLIVLVPQEKLAELLTGDDPVITDDANRERVRPFGSDKGVEPVRMGGDKERSFSHRERKSAG